METWIILGASSAMARAFARDLAGEGHHLVLCGRDMDDLERNAADAGLRGAFESLVDLGFAAKLRALENRRELTRCKSVD